MGVTSATLRSSLLAAALYAAPCTTPTPECTEGVPLGPPGRFSVVYRSHALTESNPAIRRALVVIHGIGRNADWYFASGMAGAFLAGALDDTVVVAPRFASDRGGRCRDSVAEGEISWTCGGWNGGEAPPELPDVFSYQLIDHLLAQFADENVFPNLRTIVVSGHSAGGQYVHRYLAATSVPKTLRVPVQFVVSNPSSYLYVDDYRPFAVDAPCPTAGTWKYGFEARTGYAEGVSVEDMKARMISSEVTYLLGELDNFNNGSMDATCAANLQGPNRLARGQAYHAYINSRHGAKHTLVEVPSCAHNARCMFTADPALPVLFPQWKE